jgi:hypothetical protein
MTLPNRRSRLSLCSNDIRHDRVMMSGKRYGMIGLKRMLTLGCAAVLTCGPAQMASAQAPKAAKQAPPAAKQPAPAAKPSAPAKSAAKPAPAAPSTPEPKLIGQFGCWGAYSASPNGKTVCFALAKPSSSKTNPPNRPRDPAYVFVSTRPADKVSNEVSVMIGYQLKPGADSTLEIGGTRFAMFVQGDGLWIKNAAEEERLVDALRKGTDATVKGVSAKGTETTDVFGLRGLAQALDKLAQTCK